MDFKQFLQEEELTKTELLEAKAGLVPGKAVRAGGLVKGKKYFAFYRNGGRQFMDLFTFTGASDQDKAYGESGPVFNSLKDAMKAYSHKNMKDIESAQVQLGHGHNIRLCGIWDDGGEGCYYYPFNGRWTSGSGADALSFAEAIPAQPEDI